MTDTTTPVICQINITDTFDELSRPCVTVEMRSTDPAQKDSMANVLIGWFSHNWDELFLIFRAQLKAHEQERTGAADLATSTAGPRLVDSSGQAYASTDVDQLQMQLPLSLIARDDCYIGAAPSDEPAVLSPGLTYDAPAPSCDSASSSSSSSYDSSSSCDSGSSYDSSSGSFDTNQ